MRPFRMTDARRVALAIVAGVFPAAGAIAADNVQDPNVLFLAGGRFSGGGDPIFVTGARVPGFVTGVVVPYNGASVTLSRLDASPASGFVALPNFVLNQVLPGPPGDYIVQVNQETPELFVTFKGTTGVQDPFNARIRPNGGSFRGAVLVSFTNGGGSQVRYQVNGSAFRDYTEPFHLIGNSTISYFATNGTPGPTKVATFNFTGPACFDQDADRLPDWLEVLLGSDPSDPAIDSNGNGVPDFDEVIRGGNLVAPAPLLQDTDDDGWSDFDEGLRGTSIVDGADFPVAPTLSTVEIARTAQVFSNGATPPPANPPGMPDPPGFEVVVESAAGARIGPVQRIDGAALAYRSAGDAIRYVLATANDGSGRVLARAVRPRSFCATPCPSTQTLAGFQTAWQDALAAGILDSATGERIDPRTTAEVLLLNRYLETNLRSGGPFAPGVDGLRPGATEAAELAATRSQADLVQAAANAVSPALVDVVADYYRYQREMLPRPTLAILADIVAGRAIAPEEIPPGVRTANFTAAAASAQAFLAGLGDGSVTVTGTLAASDSGPVLTAGATSYLLTNWGDTFIDGASVTARLLPNVEACAVSPLRSLVLEIEARVPVAVPPADDADGDGLADDWERYFFGDLAQAPNTDPDGDGCSNTDELAQGTNPELPDCTSVSSGSWIVR